MPRAKKPQELSTRTANKNWRHVSVYLPNAMFAKIQEQATAARRSMSSEIVLMLEPMMSKGK